MFSNLSKGSTLHGVDLSNGMKYFTGSIDRITPSISSQYPTGFGQFPSVSLDIAVTIDAKQTEFKGIPSNEAIADFKNSTVILADNKDSLYNYIKSLLKTSEDAVNEDNINWHKKRIPQYRNVLSDMIPGSTNVAEVKELREQVSNLQSQLAEALTLLKQGNTKQG